MVDQLKLHSHEHINHVDWNANVQMIDIVVIYILNNDLNNLIPISNDHEDHYNHLMKCQHVFHKNNLFNKKKTRNENLIVLIFLKYIFTFNMI
jgi:hypothetical protein